MTSMSRIHKSVLCKSHPMNVELTTPHFVQDVSHEDAVNVWLCPSVHGGVVNKIVSRGTETRLLTVCELVHSFDNNFSQDGYSMARRHSVDDGERHWDKAKQRHHRQPNLKASVVAEEAGVLKIMHGEDDQGRDEEELHVAHKVPCLPQAVTTSGDVGYRGACKYDVCYGRARVTQKRTKERAIAGKNWS